MKSRCAMAVGMAAMLLTAATNATQAEHVHVTDAWVRLLPGSLPAGGYATLHNDGPEAAVITAISSTRYGEAMIHQSDISGGMGRMAMVDRLPIGPGSVVALSPGGYHVMMSEARTPVAVGEAIPVRITFEDGSHLDAVFAARPANARGSTN